MTDFFTCLSCRKDFPRKRNGGNFQKRCLQCKIVFDKQQAKIVSDQKKQILHTHICLVCKKTFQGSKQRKYCSKECVMLTRKPHQKKLLSPGSTGNECVGYSFFACKKKTD
jgi:hypothetical protein